MHIVKELTRLAHCFGPVPHLHLFCTHDKFAVRQGQPRPTPFFCLVLQADLQSQKLLFGSPAIGSRTFASGADSDSAIWRNESTDERSAERWTASIRLIKWYRFENMHLPHFHKYFSSVEGILVNFQLKCPSWKNCHPFSILPRRATLVSSQVQPARSVYHNNNKRPQSMPFDRESLINNNNNNNNYNNNNNMALINQTMFLKFMLFDQSRHVSDETSSIVSCTE